MTKIKTTEIPRGPKNLYIQLYCEKRGGKTNENIRNASQSWLSLSLTKKQHFYDTVSTKSAIEKAQRIIQTEPFLRAKFPSHLRKQKRKNASSKENEINVHPENITTDSLVTPVHDDDTVMECDNTSNSFEQDNVVDILPEITELEADINTSQERAEECELQITQTEALTSRLIAENNTLEESALEQTQNKDNACDVKNLEKSYMSVIDEDTDTASENENTAEESIPLLEPVLPIIKTGRELYDLLRARNGVNNPYESLTAREKHFYGRAVCAIKKDYVKKYKEYLESLSPRQLFDHYMKIF